MTRIAALLAIAALTSCQSAPLPPPPAITATARPVSIDTQTALVKFHYAWPPEVSDIPALAQRFQSEMTAWRSRLLTTAAADKMFRDTQGYPFNPYEGVADWIAAGESARLLSLSRALYEYSGGAHGNHGTHALLWDRSAGAEIPFSSLFASAEAPSRLLSAKWCSAVNVERAKKRGGQRVESAEFNRCPTLDEVAIVPSDFDHDGRFERVVLTADPYVAGPYAEGDYTVSLPVSAAFLAALKPEYRLSFEAQLQ